METTTLNLVAPSGAPPSAIVTQNASSLLRDAVERTLRLRHEAWVALGLHLSRLQPPAPRPHHRRIAHAVLDDAASRRDGQLFPLENGDLVLLFPAADGGAGLAATLARLFAADSPDPDALLSRWLLPDDAEQVLAFADTRAKARALSAGPEASSSLAAVAAIAASVEPARIHALLERQTAVLLAINGPTRLLPLFREIRLSTTALETHAAAAGHVTADPFLFRHLMAALDGVVLDASAADLERDSSMVSWTRTGRPALHLNFSVETVLSPRLDDIASRVTGTGARLAVEIAMVEACAEIEAFANARERLAAAGVGLVLDDVSHHAMMITRPGALQADLLKLDWSRQILGAGDALDRVLQSFGPNRIVLHRADTEEAVRWGVARGIRRFQGRHVDAMLAAARLAHCPEAGFCTLRQCIDREAAALATGRASCRNHALLDAAVPPEVPT